MRNRIDKAFRTARKAGRAAFMPFITAGDPDVETTEALIREMARRGADLIELGIPYSDPIADGPTIQASYTRALDKGFKVSTVFEMVRRLRETDCAVPILTMVSFSILSRIGAGEYCSRAAEAGVDGLIVPDLPADERARLSRDARKSALHTVFLVAPTTPPKRMRQIVRACSGFVYYISVAGTTGARTELPPDIAEHLKALRTATDLPVAVGFGISSPEQVGVIAKVADGAIVGSAIVKRIASLSDGPRDELVREIGDFVAALAQGTLKSPGAE